jgi:putative NADH-flavin reductase
VKKLCVFGASGRTGLLLVNIAVERGHAVTAFCRSESDRQYLPEQVTCIVGDLLDREHLDRAVTGADVVICAFGPREPYRDVFCAAATGAIIGSMKAHGVERLLCITTALAGDYPGNRSRFIKAMARLNRLLKPKVAADRDEQERRVEESGLNWTIVKPSELMPENEKPRFVHGDNVVVDAYSRISRYHLSTFLLDHLEADDYSRNKVFLRY